MKKKILFYCDQPDWAYDMIRKLVSKDLENTEDYVRRSLARKAKLKHVTPVWANIGEMNTIYRNCPNGHHVDHIVPLQGAYVCGLNVEHNLQYLPAKDNLSKGNSFDSDKHIHTTEYVKPYL